MPTPFVIPTPKIGNHPIGCSCSTCANARKRLAQSPYVQLLQRELIAAHKVLGELDTSATPDLSMEHKILELTDQLRTAQDGAGLLQRTLDESRKINQEREAQLAKKTSESAQWARKAEALAQEKLGLVDALANEKRTHGDLQLAVGEIREFLHVPEDDTLLEAVEDLYSRCESWAGKAERTGEANTRLQTENKALAGEVERGALEIDELRTQLSQSADILQQERDASRGGMLITLTVAVIISAAAFFLIGRFGR